MGGIGPSIRRFLGQKARLADRGVLIVEAGLAIYDWLGRHYGAMPRTSSACALRPGGAFRP